MTLNEFVEKKGSPTLQELAETAEVSYTTLKSVRRGMRLKKYDVAKRVSEATGGKVTIKELCE